MNDYPNTPGFKAPGTSEAAAVAESGRVETLRDACFAYLLARGPHTTDEVATALGESVLSIRPRFSELRIKGKIEDTLARRKNDSGHSAVVWRAVRRLEQGELV